MITSFYTCKRPHPYIGETLESYFDFYDQKPLVFEQPGTDGYVNRTRVQVIPTTADSLLSNWLFMVQWLHDKTYDEVYMLCEDDILFRSVINLPPVSDTGFISPYCSSVNVNGVGWHEPKMIPCGFCGALCIILSRRSLEQIVSQQVTFLTLTGGLHLDAAIGKFFKNNLVHYPTLILHNGDISTYERNNDVTDPCHEKIHETRRPAL